MPNEIIDKRIHELALLVTARDLRRPWLIQTSNSHRRIGTERGDGDVLCAVTQPDGHPDLSAAPGVLEYIVAAHPFVVTGLIEQRDRARHALDHLRHKIDGHDVAFAEAAAMMDQRGDADRLGGRRERIVRIVAGEVRDAVDELRLPDDARERIDEAISSKISERVADLLMASGDVAAARAAELLSGLRRSLRDIRDRLDRVDAADSLAHLEARDS